jgi:hypothetical protein
MKEKIGKIIFSIGCIIIFLGFTSIFWLYWLIKESPFDYIFCIKFSTIIGIIFLITGNILTGFRKSHSAFFSIILFAGIVILAVILFWWFWFLGFE